jgi:predicted CXXCH cytochrome family protein
MKSGILLTGAPMTDRHTKRLRTLMAFSFVLGVLAAGNAIATGHAQCSDCHKNATPKEQGAELVHPLETLCTTCHEAQEGMGQHAVGVAPKSGNAGPLPLIDGRIACITCHDSHVETPGLLRINSEKLCLACHEQ